MGKKSRIKRRARGTAQKGEAVPPDDYFRYGPIEFARFGRFVLMRSKMSDEQFAKMQDGLVQRFPEVCREIDEKVLHIVEIVKRLPPGELLKRAYWEMADSHRDLESESEIDREGIISLRMVDYIQSVVAAIEPSKSMQGSVTEEDWLELRQLVADLFSQLNSEYHVCRSAYARRTDPNYDSNFDMYYFNAQLYWCNLRGSRYLVHQLPYFRLLLPTHNDVLIELFGVSSEELLSAMQKLQDSLAFGLHKLKEDLRRFQEITAAEVEKKIHGIEALSEDSARNIMSQVVKDNGWEKWRDDVSGRTFGLDLFDVHKITNLPNDFLEKLSWSPGQESDFFADGKYKGWPLRIWPIFKRPFLKIESGYYCFELFSFFDNFYRALQRLILSKNPQYDSEWNRKQKEVSEQVTCTLFQKLLPGAQIHRSVYYRWRTGHGNQKQWCEADALIILEDHLFIVEVKAGAFTYTPPATDFQAYIKSLYGLILRPTQQGKRFLEYLQSDNTVAIFDSNHNQIAEISKSRFECITICAITLDPLTELSAKVEHLTPIGIDVGEYPIWSLSISDLMVYTYVFENSLTFLHYVQQRMLAFHTRLIDVEDELDHLGLYLKHNTYSKYAEELKFDGRLRWNGYRSTIDRFFAKKLYDPDYEGTLKQKMPAHFERIINRLSSNEKEGRRRVSSTLLDCSGELRNLISSGVENMLKEQTNTRRAKPCSTEGDVKITVFCWQEGILERDKSLARNHTRAAMLINNDRERLLLELFFDQMSDLIGVDYEFFKIDEIPALELPDLRARADELRSRRLENAQKAGGKIGRNDPCPCGSGRKFKKCCSSWFH